MENPINLPKCRRRITCKFRGFCSTNHAVIASDEEMTCDRARALLGVGRMTNTADSCRRWTSTFVTMCPSSIIFWDIQRRMALKYGLTVIQDPRLWTHFWIQCRCRTLLSYNSTTCHYFFRDVNCHETHLQRLHHKVQETFFYYYYYYYY